MGIIPDKLSPRSRLITVEEKVKMTFLVALASCCLTGCNNYQESGSDGITEKDQVGLNYTETENSDSTLLTKFNYQIEGGEIEKAKVHASQLSSPEGRAMAFLKIVVKGKESIDSEVCKKEALTDAIQNLNSISNIEVKFALQQEFLKALFNFDPNHKQKTLSEVYAGILDNFWETSTALDSNVMKLDSSTVSMVNKLLKKSWTLETSQLKKMGLEGKIYTAKLRYPINPKKAQVEINIIKDQVWELKPLSNRIPFLLDLIEFELDVTKDVSEAKRLIRTLKKTIEMGIDA